MSECFGSGGVEEIERSLPLLGHMLVEPDQLTSPASPFGALPSP